MIRHGESIANVGENYVKRIPDHLVPLTEKGKEQAREGGKWLAEYLRQCSNQGKFYARLPMGESPFDVAVRIHQFMGTIHRDYENTV